MVRGKPRPVEHLLAQKVAETVKALTVTSADAGAVRLAERYAAVIDRAEVAVADADAAIGTAEHADTREYIEALRAKVEAQNVLERLGPKLLAVLEQLGATPAARAKAGGGAASAGPSRLQAMRAGRGA